MIERTFSYSIITNSNYKIPVLINSARCKLKIYTNSTNFKPFI